METVRIRIVGLPKDASIHIVGSIIGWGSGFKYPDPDEEGRTILEVDSSAVGDDFKHFILCKVSDRQQVLNAVRSSRCVVTGNGDAYGKQWRIWFLHPDYSIFGEGVYANNTFAEQHEH